MGDNPMRKRIFGWMMFDWASQPYNTLLLSFIFGPYFAEIVADRLMAEGLEPGAAKAQAQGTWSIGLALSGFFIATIAPVLGALADNAGRRLPYIWVFSICYVIGASGLWLSSPDALNIPVTLGFFVLGLVGMEFATAFTNAMLPDLGPPSETGRISGTGWAVGYLGGLFALVIMLLFLAENNQGKTLLGGPPLFGLDTDAREGTRSVGPFTALWFVVFMVPFFLWVHDTDRIAVADRGGVKKALGDLVGTIKRLQKSPSLAAYLASSMIYRDALAGMYSFGGVYASLVLGWSVVDVGIFAIIAVIAGALFAWIGGKADRRFGPKPVISVSIIALALSAIGIVSLAPTEVLWREVSSDPVLLGRSLPDLAFYFCGAIVGAAGGTVQSASRTMMVRQANPNRMTEAFGLYALAGKATAFLAPALVGAVSFATESQRIGVTPIVALFLLGLFLLIWVNPDGEDAAVWDSAN